VNQETLNKYRAIVARGVAEYDNLDAILKTFIDSVTTDDIDQEAFKPSPMQQGWLNDVTRYLNANKSK